MPPEPSRVNWLELSCVTNTCQPLDHKDAWLLYRKRRLLSLQSETGVFVKQNRCHGDIVSCFWNVFFPSQTITSMFQWIGFTERKLYLSQITEQQTANSKHEFLQIPLIFPKWDHHCDGHTFSCSESWEVEVEGGFQREKTTSYEPIRSWQIVMPNTWWIFMFVEPQCFSASEKQHIFKNIMVIRTLLVE